MESILMLVTLILVSGPFLLASAEPNAEDDGDMDVIFVVEESPAWGQDNFKKVNEFLAGVVKAMKDAKSDGAPEYTRIAQLTFSSQEKVQFDLVEHRYSLANAEATEQAIEKIPYSPDDGHDLKGVVLAVTQILVQQSKPDTDQLVLFITDGVDDDKGEGSLQEAVTELRKNYTTVFVLDIEDLREKDFQARSVNSQNQGLLVGNDNDYLLQVPSVDRLQDNIHNVVNAFRDFTQHKKCVVKTEPCTKSCGVGWMGVSSKCVIYVGDPPRVLSKFDCSFTTRCCIKPCQGGHGPSPVWLCRYLPPYNGHVD